MGRVPLLIYILWWLFAVRPASCQPYCSLVIKVIDPQGQRVGAPVTVEESDSRTETKDGGGEDVEFCDLGILPVTVSVGHPACNQAVVRNVGLLWGQTTRVTIVYDREPCLHDAPPVAACQILFRFRNPQQQWMANVALYLQTPLSETLTSDKFGRGLVRTPAGQRVRGRAIAEGYHPDMVDVLCDREHMLYERKITLDPQ